MCKIKPIKTNVQPIYEYHTARLFRGLTTYGVMAPVNSTSCLGITCRIPVRRPMSNEGNGWATNMDGVFR